MIDPVDVFAVENALLSEEDDYGSNGWFAWQDRAPYREDTFSEPHDVAGLGQVEMAPTYAGHEGGAEDAELVFRITFPTGEVHHYKKHGYYSSYDGTDWDGDFHPVTPTQKTITVYE